MVDPGKITIKNIPQPAEPTKEMIKGVAGNIGKISPIATYCDCSTCACGACACNCSCNACGACYCDCSCTSITLEDKLEKTLGDLNTRLGDINEVIKSIRGTR